MRTAELVVEVPDVTAAARQAGTAALAVSGTVEQEESRGGSGGAQAVATLRLRVPGDRLDGVVERVAGLGREVSRHRSSEDVTGQAVDLDSRLSTQRRSVARVRALLDRAKDLGEVVRIEGELASREADLESVLAQRAALRGQADQATLSVELRGAPDRARAAGASGFTDGLSGGLDALTAVGRVVAVTAGALLPFLPLLALAVLVAYWLSRRRGRPQPVAEPARL